MDREELSAWLRLSLTPGVGRGTARRLLAALGSPQAIFTASPEALKAVVSVRDAQALATPPENLPDQLELTWAWLCEGIMPVGTQRALLTLADSRYPPMLLQTADPPVLLFAQGRLDLLTRPGVAMVGSRSPTAQGRDNAQAFAKALSAAGVTVVSGLALGVDGSAHEGALAALAAPDATGAGSTIAVVGTGLDRVYPSEHRDLAHRIAREGLMLSEFLLGTKPRPGHFPLRNRIVAGLSRGTLVVEAALQSGSLITARLAGEMGREVMAIPGSIHSPQARGCHALIKQGAKLVETAQDVLEELQLQSPVVPGSAGAWEASVDDSMNATDDRIEADPVLAVMGFDPVSQEALSARTGMGPAELGAKLFELELSGQVARLPGQLFQRTAAA